MEFKDRVRLGMKIKLFGAEYTFTRVTEALVVNPDPIEAAYKKTTKVETTFKEWAFVRPARAYAIHSNVQTLVREGGQEMTGIINVELEHTTQVRPGDSITTPDGIYDLVAKEDFDEPYIFEGHLRVKA